MKPNLVILVIFLLACNNNQQRDNSLKVDSSGITQDTTKNNKINTPTPELSASTKYSNKRFRNVSLQKISDNKFRVHGEGQIFESNFNWVVEDGHEELYKGFEMTNAGAPEWGDFDFTVEVQKKRKNSTLTLILFETSAKDGSRQYELPIALN